MLLESYMLNVTQYVILEEEYWRIDVYLTYYKCQYSYLLPLVLCLDHLPDLYWFSDWLERTLLETKPAPKLVTVVNPGNPTGTYIPEPLLKVSLSLH